MWISQKNENSFRQENCQSSSSQRTQTTDSITYSFPKAARLRSRTQFQKVVKSGYRFSGKSVTIDYRYGDGGCPKLGITVSRRHGKAFLRNRFKRVTREAFRHLLTQLPKGLEMNASPRLLLTEYKTEIVLDDFYTFIEQLQLTNATWS